MHGRSTIDAPLSRAATAHVASVMLAALVVAASSVAEAGASPVFDAMSWPPAAIEDAGAGDADSVAEALESQAERWNALTHDALAGDPEAAYTLGRRFAEKQGPRAQRRALEWLGQAARAGHADAMFHLSRVQARIVGAQEGDRLESEAATMAAARAADDWRERARRAGSVEAFGWGCASAFDDQAPPAQREAAGVDCYVGRAISAAGSRSRAWFDAKWEAVPGSARLPERLWFRAALLPHAHLLPDDPVVLATRIRPAEHAKWRLHDVPLVPLVLGHSWTWETQEGDEIVERVSERLERDDATWFALETRAESHEPPAEHRLARVDAKGLHELDGPVEALDGGAGERTIASHLVFPFPAGVGSEVVVRRASGEIGVIRVVGEGLVVQTPAGRFECMRYAYSIIDPERGPTRTGRPPMTLDYAPGVGLVRTGSPLHGSPTRLVGYDLSTPVPAAPR